MFLSRFSALHRSLPPPVPVSISPIGTFIYLKGDSTFLILYFSLLYFFRTSVFVPSIVSSGKNIYLDLTLLSKLNTSVINPSLI